MNATGMANEYRKSIQQIAWYEPQQDSWNLHDVTAGRLRAV
jgi:hypothetical protein